MIVCFQHERENCVECEVNQLRKKLRANLLDSVVADLEDFIDAKIRAAMVAAKGV